MKHADIIKFELTQEELTQEESDEFHTWWKQHRKICKVQNRGAIGGGDSFVFTPTGLGVIVEYRCACGAILDICGSEKW